MKQIFDWLREQMRERIKLYQTLDVTETAVDVAIKETERLIEYINEAESKLGGHAICYLDSPCGYQNEDIRVDEADCCEWKRGSENKDILFAPHEQVSAIYESCLPMYPYCSVCGKPIKISEVE